MAFDLFAAIRGQKAKVSRQQALPFPAPRCPRPPWTVGYRGTGRDPIEAWDRLVERVDPRHHPFKDLSRSKKEALWDFVPDMRWYDLIVINSSGGKDSMVAMDVALAEAEKAGVLDRVILLHNDLGVMEWPGTKDLVARHAKARKTPLVILGRTVAGREEEVLLERIRRRALDMLRADKGDKSFWPDHASRYCTKEYKTGEVAKLMTAMVDHLTQTVNVSLVPAHNRELSDKARADLARLERAGKRFRRDGAETSTAARLVERTSVTDQRAKHHRPVRFLNVVGLRADESERRGNVMPFRIGSPAEHNPNRRAVHVWLPVHGWNVDEVWGAIRASGLPWHPAYDMGMSRLSCRICPLAASADLVTSALANPDLAKRYLAVETQFGHPIKKSISMKEIVDIARALKRRGFDPLTDPETAREAVEQILAERTHHRRRGRRPSVTELVRAALKR